MKAGSALCFTRYPFCYLLFLLSFISTQLPAQAPTIYWEQYYGGTKVDFSGRLKKTVDNGFVIAGYDVAQRPLRLYAGSSSSTSNFSRVVPVLGYQREQ